MEKNIYPGQGNINTDIIHLQEALCYLFLPLHSVLCIDALNSIC